MRALAGDGAVDPHRTALRAPGDVEGDRDVYLKGSAERQDLALRFAQDLRRNKELAAYTWETPYPVNEKDGKATFTYQGKFRANTQP